MRVHSRCSEPLLHLLCCSNVVEPLRLNSSIFAEFLSKSFGLVQPLPFRIRTEASIVLPGYGCPRTSSSRRRSEQRLHISCTVYNFVGFCNTVGSLTTDHSEVYCPQARMGRYYNFRGISTRNGYVQL